MEAMDVSARKPYPSDVTDAEWEYLVPDLTLMREDAPQRKSALREVRNGARYVTKTGCQSRMLPHDLPPWFDVYQQAWRWFRAGMFETIAHDLRLIVRTLAERNDVPSAAIFDARTL